MKAFWTVTLAIVLVTSLRSLSDERKEKVTDEKDSAGKRINKDGIELSVRLPKENVAGNAIAAQLSLKNGSNEEVVCEYSTPYRDFDVCILRGNGEKVPMTRFGGNELDRDLHPIVCHSPVSLHTGEVTSVKLNLARLFDLSMAGEYVLKAGRTVNNFAIVRHKIKRLELEMAFTVVDSDDTEMSQRFSDMTPQETAQPELVPASEKGN